MIMIPIDHILPNPDQPRRDFDSEELAGLAISIRQHGLIQPIVVEPAGDGYLIVDGERRWRAGKIAGLTEIPAIVRPASNGGGGERFILALVANIQRSDLTPGDEARAYQKLLDQGWTRLKIARELGVSLPRINDRLELLKLEVEIQQLVNSGQLPKDIRTVQALLTIEDSQQRITLAKRLAEQKAPVKVIVEAAQRLRERLNEQLVPADQVAALRFSQIQSGPVDSAKWNALVQLGHVPPWPWVQSAAREACDNCTLRPHASPITCRGCELVEMLRILIRLSNGSNHGPA